MVAPCPTIAPASLILSEWFKVFHSKFRCKLTEGESLTFSSHTFLEITTNQKQNHKVTTNHMWKSQNQWEFVCKSHRIITKIIRIARKIAEKVTKIKQKQKTKSTKITDAILRRDCPSELTTWSEWFWNEILEIRARKLAKSATCPTAQKMKLRLLAPSAGIAETEQA